MRSKLCLQMCSRNCSRNIYKNKCEVGRDETLVVWLLPHPSLLNISFFLSWVSFLVFVLWSRDPGACGTDGETWPMWSLFSLLLFPLPDSPLQTFPLGLPTMCFSPLSCIRIPTQYLFALLVKKKQQILCSLGFCLTLMHGSQIARTEWKAQCPHLSVLLWSSSEPAGSPMSHIAINEKL